MDGSQQRQERIADERERRWSPVGSRRRKRGDRHLDQRPRLDFTDLADECVIPRNRVRQRHLRGLRRQWCACAFDQRHDVVERVVGDDAFLAGRGLRCGIRKCRKHKRYPIGVAAVCCGGAGRSDHDVYKRHKLDIPRVRPDRLHLRCDVWQRLLRGRGQYPDPAVVRWNLMEFLDQRHLSLPRGILLRRVQGNRQERCNLEFDGRFELDGRNVWNSQRHPRDQLRRRPVRGGGLQRNHLDERHDGRRIDRRRRRGNRRQPGRHGRRRGADRHTGRDRFDPDGCGAANGPVVGRSGLYQRGPWLRGERCPNGMGSRTAAALRGERRHRQRRPDEPLR